MDQRDDLFNNNETNNSMTYKPQAIPNDKHRLTNIWILLAYFVFMFASSIASGLIQNNHLEQTKNDLTEGFTYTWTQTDEGYDLLVEGVIVNQTNEQIESAFVQFDFFEEFSDEASLQKRIYVEDLAPLESRNIEETLSLDQEYYRIFSNSTVSINRDFANVFQLTMSLLVLIALILINKRRYKHDFSEFKRAPKKYFGHVLSGFILVYVAAYAAQVIMITIGVTETSQNEMAIQSMFSSDWITIVSLFLTLVIITPIVEETVFRKALYGLVRPSLGDLGAILISGLIFGFLHVASWGDFIQIIPYGILGLSFSYIYYYSGRNIYVIIIIHALNNLIPYLRYTLELF
jgi:hypothetical protein